jgi:sec-independent protein translocase protein TatC
VPLLARPRRPALGQTRRRRGAQPIADPIWSAQAPPYGTPTEPPRAETPSPEPPPPNGSSPPEEGTMTILEHLEELRQRIMVAGIALLVGMAISGFLLTQRMMEWLVHPGVQAMGGRNPIVTNPPEVFIAYLKVALFTGAALAMPVMLHQFFLFILPALTASEKRVAYLFVPGATLSFALGVAFGYFVILPPALTFLGGFGQGTVDALWSIGPYLSFVTSLLFWIGVAFEMPLVIFTLAKVGVVSYQQLKRYRKFAFLGAFVGAAIITPTPDPFNQTLVGLPLYLLFELGLLLARWAR